MDTAIQTLIKQNINTKHLNKTMDYSDYIVSILNYTFTEKQIIYGLDEHIDNCLLTILIYLEKNNVNDNFYIEECINHKTDIRTTISKELFDQEN